VSRITQISFLLSFNITSAAREMRSFEMPLAILPSVPIEQGIMIIVPYWPDPEANGAVKSDTLKFLKEFF